MPPFFLSYPVHNLLFKRLSFPCSFPSADQIFFSILPDYWTCSLNSNLFIVITVYDCILYSCSLQKKQTKNKKVMHLVASCTYVRICILPLSSNNHLNFVFFIIIIIIIYYYYYSNFTTTESHYKKKIMVATCCWGPLYDEYIEPENKILQSCK